MENCASFRFYDSLIDFLHQSSKDRPIPYPFNGCPSVKDAIEAIGIPHPEVDRIVANGLFVDFCYSLRDKDVLQAYPIADLNDPTPHSLTPVPTFPIRFVADVHVGKLARSLRMLGFDTVYNNSLTDTQIAALAQNEERVVLTRDLGLLKHRNIQWGYWLRSQQAVKQLAEVVKRFHLAASFFAFTRCIYCNGDIVPVTKETVLPRLPEKTIEYFNDFYQCKGCKKIYWKGSHYENMCNRIRDFIKLLAVN